MTNQNHSSIRSVLILFFLIISQFIITPVRGEKMAVYITKTTKHSYIMGLDKSMNGTTTTYTWYSYNYGKTLTYSFSGEVCNKTLSITVGGDGTSDSDNDNCSIWDRGDPQIKGSDRYSVSGNFYSFPALSTSNLSGANCVSDVDEDNYTFNVDRTCTLITSGLVSNVYLQIANNASFSGARNITINSSSNSLSYADLAGSNTNDWYGTPLYYRLKLVMSNGNSLYGATQGQTAFFPDLALPGDVVVVPPACSYSSPTIKIPQSTTADYVITIKGNWSGSQGYNFFTSNMTASNGYYILTESTACTNADDGTTQYMTFTPGNTYNVTLEQESTLDDPDYSPCAATTTFTVPEIPDLTITKESYDLNITDNNGNDVQIAKYGGSGVVNLYITGSNSNSVTITAGSNTFSKTLSTNYTVNSKTYYKGTVSISLLAGTYNTYVSNTSCTSDPISVSLNEPDPISYDVSKTTISCNSACISGEQSDGSITISNVSGGVGSYTYSINSEEQSSATFSSLSYAESGYSISVSDDYDNITSTTEILDQNAALSCTFADSDAPTMSCLSDGTITIEEASGGSGTYSFSTSSSGGFSSSKELSGYSSGTQYVYIKDNLSCIGSQSTTVPAAPPVMTVTNGTATSPDCYNYNNGSYTCTVENVLGSLSVSGLTATISGNQVTFSDLVAGQYEVTFTDTYNGNICTLDASFSIAEKPTISVSSNITPVSDKGSATGSVDLLGSGGNSSPYKYYLYDEDEVFIDYENNTSGTATFDGLTGNYEDNGKLYYVDVVDALGCSYSEDNNSLYQVRIQEPYDTLQIDYSITHPIDCYGDSNSTIQLSASGGWSDKYEFSEDNNNWTSETAFSGYPIGYHTFYVTDLYGGKDSISVFFDQPAPLSASLDSIQNNLCFGESRGWIRFNVSGGTFPYSFADGRNDTTLFRGEDTLLSATDLLTDSYNLQVQDQNGCVTDIITENITEPEELLVRYTDIVHTTCELDNGAISIAAKGGVTPFNFHLTSMNGNTNVTSSDIPGNDTCVFGNLEAGSYTIEVIDSNECITESNLQTVNPYTNPSITEVQITDVRCFGESNGELQINTKTGNSPIQKYVLAANSSSIKDTNSTGLFTGLPYDTYQLSVFDSIGCRSNNLWPAKVDQPDDSLYILIDSIYPVINKGTASGNIKSTIYGGNSGLKTAILYNESGVLVDSTNERSNFAYLTNDLFAGTYTFFISDSKSCKYVSDTFVIPEPDTALGFIVTEKSNALCKAQIGSFTVSAYGGWGDYSYKKATDNGYYSFNTFENLYAGNYLVSVRDKLGAVYSDTVTIYEPKDSLKAIVPDFQSPTCNNNGTITVNVTGGTQPYQLWFDSEADTTKLPSSQDIVFSNRFAGDYLIHISDSNGCKFEIETSLSDTALLQIDGFDLTYPSSSGGNDGAVRALTEGGEKPLSFSWKEKYGATYSETSDILSDIPSEYYEVSVAETGGCSQTDWTYLPGPDDQSLTLIEKGDETSFEAFDGYAVFSTTSDVLTQILLITPEDTRYIYSTTDSTDLYYQSDTLIHLNNLSGGNYFISTTDTSGIIAYAEFEIETYDQFVIESADIINITRTGESNGSINISVSGGAGNNIFSWECLSAATDTVISVSSENTSVAKSLPAGNYKVIVTDKYNNSITETYSVEEPDSALKINIAEYRNESCKNYEDAYVVVEASGGWGDYQYRFDSSEYYSNSNQWLNLAVRDYYFFLTDKMGVTDSILVTITEPDYLTSSILFVDSVNCLGATDGNIDFSIMGGTKPYRYTLLNTPGLWEEDTVARNLSEGIYTFVFTDSNDCICQDTLTTYMPEPDSLLFIETIITHTTCEEDNGSVTVALQGGTKPYQYEWKDSDNNLIGSDSNITGLAQSGYYYLDVYDRHNCPQHFEQYINPSTNPLITDIDTTPVLCNGGYTGTANITGVTAGDPYAPYDFTWSNADTGTLSDGYKAGIHSVTVTDTNSCSTTAYFEVTEPDSLWVFITDSKDAHCYGYSDGYLYVEAIGGMGGYSYLWSNGDTTNSPDSLSLGSYTVLLTDSNQCKFERTFNINEPEMIILNLGDDLKICPGNTITLDGDEFISYKWSTSDSVFSDERFVSVNNEGDYFLEVEDSIGCFGYDTITITMGSDALQADFLMASEANLYDTLVVLEMSNLELDSLHWEFSSSAFENITSDDLSDYVLELLSQEIGIHNIGLWAYSGGCVSNVIKQVDIGEANDTVTEEDNLGYVDPMIESMVIAPNPNDGYFTLAITLREEADIRVIIYNVNYGSIVDDREEYGLKEYEINYELYDLNTGVYVIILDTQEERKQKKMIIQ